MTKQAYFDMCEQLGTEPVEEEIPVELEDLPSLVQTCFVIYSYLTDIWDNMGGAYLGKDYSIVFDLLQVYQVDLEEQILVLDLLQYIDSSRSKVVNEKLQQQKTPQK